MGVPDPKKAQKPRFCARNARKRGFQTPKAHKNADFVLGVAQISTERPSAAGKTHPKRNKTAWNEAQRPEAQRNATATQRNTRNETEAQGNATHATQAPRNCTMGHNKKGDNLSGCLL